MDRMREREGFALEGWKCSQQERHFFFSFLLLVPERNEEASWTNREQIWIIPVPERSEGAK